MKTDMVRYRPLRERRGQRVRPWNGVFVTSGVVAMDPLHLRCLGQRWNRALAGKWLVNCNASAVWAEDLIKASKSRPGTCPLAPGKGEVDRWLGHASGWGVLTAHVPVQVASTRESWRILARGFCAGCGTTC